VALQDEYVKLSILQFIDSVIVRIELAWGNIARYFRMVLVELNLDGPKG
jgi:hypothetical protein